MIASKQKQLTPKQLDWVARMRANLQTLHNGWYGWDGNDRVFGGMDQELFFETDRKILTETVPVYADGIIVGWKIQFRYE